MSEPSKEGRTKYILTQLGVHLPYSIFGVMVAMMMMGILTFLATLMRSEDFLPEASGELFHVFHASHVLISTVVATAMFWKHEKRVFKAILVGMVGSIGLCTLSDIIFPYIGGTLLKMDMSIHICVFEHPNIVIPFAFVGMLGGFLLPGAIEKSTQYSHSAHILVSSVAAQLYLVAYGLQDWVHYLGWVLVITLVSHVIPCCFSDIVFPLCCVHRDCIHPKYPGQKTEIGS